MSHIKSRSPYFVADNATNMASATLKLYIYTGQQTVDRPSTPTYELFSTSINEEVVFEIGQLINDKIQFINDGTYRTDGVWVDYEIVRNMNDGTTSTQTMVKKFSIDGYTYYTDGANYTTNARHLLSVDSIRCLSGRDFEFPVNRNNTSITEVELVKSFGSNVSTSLTTTDLSGQVIKYINMVYDIANTSIKLKNSSGSVIKEIPITYEAECTYDPRKLTFINKEGAMEDLWFFKVSKDSLKTEKQTYQNNNIVSGGTYNVQAGQNKVFNITSKESSTLNTGFISEVYNESFTQLMQSDSVWMTLDRDLIPVIVKSEDFQYKTSLNDKMINYTIDVEYAFNKMNTVR